MKITHQLVLEALSNVCDPLSGIDIVSAGMVEDEIYISGNSVYLSILFDDADYFFAKSILEAAERAILTHIGSHLEIQGNIKLLPKETAILETDLPHEIVKVPSRLKRFLIIISYPIRKRCKKQI
jgi:Iron-sulfur cluster assembly protein